MKLRGLKMSYQELYKVLTTELEWTKEIAEKHIEWLKNKESLWKKENEQ